jgi:DNA polymerase-4
VARVCRELLEALFPLPRGIRLLGITFSNLEPAGLAAGRQLVLGF